MKGDSICGAVAKLTLAAAIVNAVIAILCGWAIGGTPEDASFLVRIPGAAGSGVAISEDVIATNAHVVAWRHRSDVTVMSFADRSTHNAATVAVDPDADLCLLYVRGAKFSPVPLGRSEAGRNVYLLGWGRQGILARGLGKILRVESRQRARSVVPFFVTAIQSDPGDSGGGIFDDAGNLVALNWGRYSHTGQSLSTPAEYLSQIHGQWVETCRSAGMNAAGSCGPGGYTLPNAGSGFGPAAPKWPVQRPPPQQLPPTIDQAPPLPITPLPPVVSAPPLVKVPEQPAIDASKIADAILEKMAGDARFRGPKGDTGPAGPPGPKGDPGSASIDVDELARAVLARINPADLAAMLPTKPNEVHYVVVGDDRTPGWSTVLAAYRSASAAYRGLRLAPPPIGFVGQLPALVRYENGLPEYVARGSYQVTEALGRISRGQGQ